MEILVKFNKDRAQNLLKSFHTGTPINPPTDGWTGNDLLALAGACYFAAMSHGPESFWCRDISASLRPEYREAEEFAFFDSLHAAIEYYGQLTGLVQDGQYDEGFDPDVRAMVRKEGDSEIIVRPISGFHATGQAE